MSIRHCILLLALFAFVPATAQKYLGIATGNWGGMNSVYLNPANLADNRYKLAVDVFGINLAVDNNLGKIDVNKGISRFFGSGLDDVNDVFTFSNNQQFSLLAPYGELRGPGFIATLSKRHSIAFSTRIRGINQFHHFDQSLYRTIADTAYAERVGDNIDLTAKDFNWTAHIWGEFALSYGGVLLQKGRSQLKAGATFRYLTGFGYLGLKGKNLDAHYEANQDSFYARNTDLEYSSNIFNASTALRSDASFNTFTKNYNISNGVGIGCDLGLVYEFIEDTISDRYDMDGKLGVWDPSKNRYKFRVSVAVTDIGHITYKQDQNFGINVRGDGYLTGPGFNQNVKSVDDFRHYALQQGFSVDTFHRTTRLYMPATLTVGGDYHIKKEYYVNALFVTNIANRSNYGNSYYDVLAITPRYETAKYMVSVPISYGFLSQSVKMGVCARVLGFYLGSDDCIGFFTKKQYGINVYAGAFVPIGRKLAADRDGDHVSDRKDLCPDDYGTWERKGCPEKEEDDKGADKDEDRDAKGKDKK